MRKIIFKCDYSPGDVLMLTAAIRDLHLTYPGKFLTDVQTLIPAIWENNPYLTPLKEGDASVEVIECGFPLISQANSRPVHYVSNFVSDFNSKLNLNIAATAFKGDIHLSAEEKEWTPQVHEICGSAVPYWVLVAGGKNDATTKWWDPERFQQVVESYSGRIPFVQVGRNEDFHPRLDGVIDLRGKTSIRQLIRLVYHSQGVLCPVTFAMHLAAAVEVAPGGPKNRPCVVIAGGREPVNWEAYPHHQFLHTVGSLQCCDNGGCWKARVKPVGDGDDRDLPQNLCVNVVGELPKCMDMISVQRVKAAISLYFDGGICAYLTASQWTTIRKTLKFGEQVDWDLDDLEAHAFQMAADSYIKAIKRAPVPNQSKGRGIVICAGGSKYLPCAWVAVKSLRSLGCSLPIELWHLGEDEMPLPAGRAFEKLGVTLRDAFGLPEARAARRLGGWELKPFAILHSSLEQVLLLDADNVPLVDPTFLFDCDEFVKDGALFWPDIRPGIPRDVWRIFGIPFREEPEFESGQILVDKIRCYGPLKLALWYNEHSDFYYRWILGDKDTFHMAFRKMDADFHLVKKPPAHLTYALLQYDPRGRSLFFHRNGDKWSLTKRPLPIEGFAQAKYLRYLSEYRALIKVKSDKLAGSRLSEHLYTPLNENNALAELNKAVARLSGRKPFRFHGRGIVICGGGRYLPGAYVLASLLRQQGCQLPIQLWFLSAEEMPERYIAEFHKLHVELVNAADVRRRYPVRRLFGWELKPYAIIHSPFNDVLLLDADNVPTRNPEFLFDEEEYGRTGAVFWPDLGRLKSDRSIWSLTGVDYRDEPEFESGQILVNKQKCWKTLQLTMWFNEYSDFFYNHIHGDKETFHFAFRKLAQSFSMPAVPVRTIDYTLCQHDFSGKVIFQHRNGDKWRLDGQNKVVSGFRLEGECFRHLSRLRTRIGLPPILRKAFSPERKSAKLIRIAEEITTSEYQYIRIGHDQRPMTFTTSGSINVGGGACEQFWDIREEPKGVVLIIYSDSYETCKVYRKRRGYWEGRWLRFEKMPVQLISEIGTRRKPKLVRMATSHKPTRRVYFRTPLTGFTGYGLHAIQIVSDFQRLGYEFDIRVVHMNERFATVPHNVKSCIVSEEGRPSWELVLHPPGFTPLADRRTVFFTMWESTRLPGHAVEGLNRAEIVIVPCQWNASVFSASGVDRPISVVQLGIKTSIFKPTPPRRDGRCIFLTGGRLESGGTRKSLDSAIRLFQRAFPKEKDVALEVKVFPDCSVVPVSDRRVTVHRKYFTEIELAEWFASGTCFVSCARAEGWGLMQQQALAVGRPVISIGFGGVTEFLTAENSYIVGHSLVPSSGIYAGYGVWAKPNEDDVIEAMRMVYRNPGLAERKGQNGADFVKQFSWKRSCDKLRELLIQNDFLPK